MFFAIKNWVSQDARSIEEPWNYIPVIPESIHTKDEFRKWLSRPDTDHLIVSGIEGLNPNVRVTEKNDNPAYRLHGLIVDYDAVASVDAVALIEETMKGSPALLPNWMVTTMSNHRRLVWEFEEPMGINAALLWENLVPIFKKQLKLAALLPGLDEACLKNPSTYYEVGKTWTRINEIPLPKSILRDWFLVAAEKLAKKGKKLGDVEIPMEEVFKRINERFPGRWPADTLFTEGCRGPAVWASESTNPSSTVYRKHGAYCFSAEKAFWSYPEILGEDFCRKWAEDQIGAATENIYYAKRAGYYRKFPNGEWSCQPKEDVALYLRGCRNLSSKAPAPNAPSEVERAILHIQHTQAIDGALPVPHDGREVVRIGDSRFLNVSRAKCLEPAEDNGSGDYAWGEDFPWIANWLIDFFEPRTQLIYFLAWLRRRYITCRAKEPKNSLAVFLVGGVNRGKTLMNAWWIPHIMGGGDDPKGYLVLGDTFNKGLVEAPHWHLDDSEAVSSAQGLQRYTERVKSVIANSTIPYQPKYVDAQKVPCTATLMVTLNEDPESLKLIPDLDRNIEDKVMVLHVSPRQMEFKGHHHTEHRLTMETPAFLRWLIHWTPPESVANDKFRMGVKPYISNEVRNEATVSGFSSDLLDVLEIMWRNGNDLLAAAKDKGYWEGTSAELSLMISQHQEARHLLSNPTTRGVGIRLSKLAKVVGSGITALKDTKSKKTSQKFRIDNPNI